jgi:tetratricopeptide (TPR) repeat protein
MKSAKRSREYLKVLEHGEHVLTKNPWDLGAQTDMAEAFDSLNLLDLAVLTLDQARQKYPKDPALNRQLARLFEKRGDFQRAIVLWQLVREAVPTDVEASHKAKDLAASETIARGQYEESVAGTKSSPVLDRIESRAVEQQDRLGREIESIQKRIEAAPSEPTLYVQLAQAYRKAGSDDRAKATLTQGLAPTGQHATLKQELIELELEPLRKIARALQNPDDDPDQAEARRVAANVEIAKKEIELFRLKIDRSPGDGPLRIELGRRLLDADRVDEAIAELQASRKDDKVKGLASLHLGLAFRKRNNWRLAQRNFEEALNALPTNDDEARKDVLYHLAVGCAENGDIPRALDLGHELANMEYGYRNIGTLIDKWEGR